jgi:hypothetical protein
MTRLQTPLVEREARKLRKVLQQIANNRWPKKRSKHAKRLRRWCARMACIIADLYPLAALATGFHLACG